MNSFRKRVEVDVFAAAVTNWAFRSCQTDAGTGFEKSGPGSFFGTWRLAGTITNFNIWDRGFGALITF
jgi:hypothetical protein